MISSSVVVAIESRQCSAMCQNAVLGRINSNVFCFVFFILCVCVYTSVPGPVGRLSFTEILDTSLRVSWEEPVEKNGIITGRFCPTYCASTSNSSSLLAVQYPWEAYVLKKPSLILVIRMS